MARLPEPKRLVVPPIPNGWYFHSYKILLGNNLAVVTTDIDLIADFEDDRTQNTARRAWKLASDAAAKIWIVYEDQLVESLAFELIEPFPIVEQFVDGRWLVANSRSSGDGNVRIFRPNGSQARRIELGDGIAHIKIDQQGRIWVGWFDEGALGNDHWKPAGHASPPSAHGIAAFDSHGNLLEAATSHSIIDCYALNVFRNEAWACPYTDFPIWSFQDGTERTRATKLIGTSAIAIKDDFLLAAGGYNEDKNRLFLLKLANGTTEMYGRWRLPLEHKAGTYRTYLDGRGDEIHLVKKNEWLCWRVEDFVSSYRD
ncbi:MAG: hypothetical protein AAGB02_01825 [Pseudomonadota bacterium]